MAKNLSCPVPTNINPLSPNGFNFSIQKMPGISFFCQEVNLPGLTLPTIEVLNPLGYTPFAGDIINWDDLSIQFLIDEDMANYRALYDWITGLGFPTDHSQFQDFADSQNNYSGRLMKEFSDGTLQILGSNNQPVQTIRYADIVITSIGAMTFTSTSTDVNYLIGNATFKYNMFEFSE
jgi:hypothetical protein